MRKVCPECSAERPINDEESRVSGLRPGTPVRFANTLKAEDREKRKQEGTLCTRCNGSGYQGRIGAYELMKVNREIQDSIKKQMSTQEIETVAVENGMWTLKKYAADLVEKQLTTISEMMKISNTGF
jgi:type IV pilus assembly protein PilB